VVVTFGVLVSWFVSLTLTPMLCSRFLKVEQQLTYYDSLTRDMKRELGRPGLSSLLSSLRRP